MECEAPSRICSGGQAVFFTPWIIPWKSCTVSWKEGTVLENAKCATDRGIAVFTHLKQGHAGTEIIALAEQEKTDLIMVGSHGKSNTDRLLIGSVSTFVVTHSTVATMVVRS
jgi:nucleotide-binding universal stress UspA family protein